MFHYLKKFISIIRSFIYGLIMNPTNPSSTYHTYNLLLDEIKDGSSILDVGSGDGIYFTNPEVIKKIKEKNLKIKCIDIDANAIEICIYRIIKNKLKDYVDAECIDLLDINQKYDYVVFMDCYPVIELSLMNKLINHTKKITKNIFLLNNLFEKKNYIMSFLKPKLKYFILNDFGRLTTVSQMEEIIHKWNFKIYSIKNIIQNTFGEMIHIFNYVPFLKNFEVSQYIIIIENEEME